MVTTFTDFPITQIQLTWMLQPMLLTNENQKQGQVIVTEEKASIYDFREKPYLLHRTPSTLLQAISKFRMINKNK